MSNATKTAKRSDFKKYFQFMWRSLNIQASWNYERQMNMGFLYGIAPTLDELYPDENDPEQLAHKKEAYEREMAFYNCTPRPVPLRWVWLLPWRSSTPPTVRTSTRRPSTPSRPR